MATFGFFGLISLANAHSWLHCSDYRGDVANYEDDQCFGHPRPKNNNFPDAGTFGQDMGFDTQSGECQSYDSDSNNAQFPMATYARGQTVTIAWPSKNHVAATCTNAFIPDTSTKLFVSERADTPTNLVQVPASFSEDPHVNGQIDFKGFQNCPDFCSNMDKSLCTGTFVVPDNLANGVYTFQWEWVFNAGAAPYVSCFEATIDGETSGNPSPTPPSGPAPTSPPTTAEEANCGAMGSQCDGALFNGAGCCQSGLTCFRESEWFSQCLSTCPNDWECSETATCASGGEQCGGMYHNGPTCCSSGSCYENSPYYSQCRGDCPSEWSCANQGQEFGTGKSGIGFGLGVVMIFLILGAGVLGVLYGRCWERKKAGEVLTLKPKKTDSFDGTSIPMTKPQRKSTLTMPGVDATKPKRTPPPRPPAPPAAAQKFHVEVV